jgi:hypothetical protein
MKRGEWAFFEMQIAECRMQIEKNSKIGNPKSKIERPMLALYLNGTGLPARPELASRNQRKIFFGKKAYGYPSLRRCEKIGLHPFSVIPAEAGIQSRSERDSSR